MKSVAAKSLASSAGEAGQHDDEVTGDEARTVELVCKLEEKLPVLSQFEEVERPDANRPKDASARLDNLVLAVLQRIDASESGLSGWGGKRTW